MASAKSLLSGLTDKGGRATTVLERIGLSPTILKEEHFPVRKSGELALAISEQLEDETLGFLRRRTPPGSIEMSLYALTSAANLREALDRLTHYWPLINSEIN
ncbi:MAG: AraC family transcriptional regulator ligand-binding domain-containing protein, partial [Pseudomonadota bacterium]|nr:AraC family transcriptional regulator ligand-binding domain-containing protein [Pseudomonadota bacterium]